MKFATTILMTGTLSLVSLAGCASNKSSEVDDSASNQSSLSSSDCTILQGPLHSETVMKHTPDSKVVYETVIGRGLDCPAKCDQWIEERQTANENFRATSSAGFLDAQGVPTVVCSVWADNVPIEPPKTPCQILSQGTPSHLTGPFQSPYDSFSSADTQYAIGFGDEQACAYTCGQWRKDFQRTTGTPWTQVYSEFDNFQNSAQANATTGLYMCRVGRYNP